MSIIEQLNSWDTSLFLLLNGIHAPATDLIMWWISKPHTWLPLYLLLLYFLFSKKGWKFTLIILVSVALLILVSDQLSVHLFKNVFQRLRPSNNPEIREFVHIVKGYRGGDFGFISSHASNFFSTAIFLLHIFRLKWYTVLALIIATVVSFSRIYLGVHYPGDVFCGALFGSMLGFIFYRVMESLYLKKAETGKE
jgi:undecaprenyl-diphosphatase